MVFCLQVGLAYMTASDPFLLMYSLRSSLELNRTRASLLSGCFRLGWGDRTGQMILPR